jgi:hypothetical protein
MDKTEALDLLTKISQEYENVPGPKYRNIDPKQCESLYRQLQELKSEVSETELYQRLQGALSQILAKQSRLTNKNSKKSAWVNASERGINKAIQPLVRKPGRQIEYPFQGQDPVTGNTCSISNGHWEARNYMVMDVLAYFYLLKEGGDRVPEQPSEIFTDIESIRKRELEHEHDAVAGNSSGGLKPLGATEIQSILSSKNWVMFNDGDFRRFTGLKLRSSDIMALLQETSRVEFKLVYPVRLKDEKGKNREKLYAMNMFSRLFEFGYIDEDVRNGQESVYMRRYYVTFNTILGELFAHNLKALNYDWVERELYALPPSAQLFFRRCLVHNDNPVLEFNLETISQRLNLTDKHQANRISCILDSTLEPLKEKGMIESFEQRNGLSGPKFIVYRNFDKNDDKGGKAL